MTASATDSVKTAGKLLPSRMEPGTASPVERLLLSKPRPKPIRPVLRFSPTAWAKLLFLRDRGPTEVGGFAVTRADDLLYVQDIRLVRQRTTMVTVKFDDAAVADYFDEQIDWGLRPEQFARIWVHTHPGDCPRPSSVDEETFQRVFGRAHWAVMFILAAGGRSYARLQYGVGPGGSKRLPVRRDWRRPFAAADHEVWEREYQECVEADELAFPWSDLGECRGARDEFTWVQPAGELGV